MHIGQRVAAVRAERGLTQRKLAALVNVSPSYISQLERGLKGATLETLQALAGALQVDMLAFSTELAPTDRTPDLLVDLRTFLVTGPVGDTPRQLLACAPNSPRTATVDPRDRFQPVTTEEAHPFQPIVVQDLATGLYHLRTYDEHEGLPLLAPMNRDGDTVILRPDRYRIRSVVREWVHHWPDTGS